MTRDFIPTHNSLAAAVNVAWDATGIYPEWYQGPKTTRGADIWVLGDTTDNTRDAAQRKLFGPNIERPGWTDRPGDEAMINEKFVIGRPTRKSTGGAIDTIKVQHVPSQTVSTISFKTHSMEQQALASWSGQRAWIDEECPIDILDEIIARMSSTNGIIYCTYCPQHGRTPFVNFMENNAGQDVFLVKLTYDHVRHITEETKARNIRLWAHNPALLAARTRGEAVANTGLIFTFPTEKVLYDPRQVVISSRWPRLSGMDVGWVHPTAACAIAIDPLADVAYLYATYEQVEKPPAYHHAQLRQWGENMRFMIDLAAGQRGQKDGEKIIEEYWELAHGKAWEDIEEKNRQYVKASRAFQVTMSAMWHRFDTQRLFINRNLRSLIQQYDSYIWNKDGEQPADETPARKYDIITSARYGVYGISDYATCLDDTPPWGRMEFEESVVVPPEWRSFKAGDERGMVDSFGRPY